MLYKSLKKIIRMFWLYLSTTSGTRTPQPQDCRVAVPSFTTSAFTERVTCSLIGGTVEPRHDNIRRY